MVQLTLKELLATFYQAAIIFHFMGLFLTDSQAFATKPTITSKIDSCKQYLYSKIFELSKDILFL